MVVRKLADGVADCNFGSSTKNSYLPYSPTQCLPKNCSLKIVFATFLLDVLVSRQLKHTPSVPN
jgi:hypothetical protein